MKNSEKNSQLLYKGILSIIKELNSYNPTNIIMRIKFLNKKGEIDTINFKTGIKEIDDNIVSLIKNYIDVENEIDINCLFNLLNDDGFITRISDYDEQITLDMLINPKLTNNIKKV